MSFINRLLGAAFAPDGRTLYSGGLDSSVIKWDVSGRRSFGITVPDVRHGSFPALGGSPSYVAWAANRRHAVIGFTPGIVAAIDTATGTVTARGNPMKELENLTVSADGRFAYLVSTDGELRRWNTAVGRVDKTTRLNGAQHDCFVSLSPDGRLLAVSACSYSSPATPMPVLFADAKTLKRVGPLINLGYDPATTQFSPDGRLIALGSGYGRPGLAIADPRTGRVRWANQSISDVTAIGFSSDGQRLVVGTLMGKIATFDANSGRRLVGPVAAHAGLLIAAAFAPDGRTILTSGTDGTARLWDAASLGPVGEPLRAAPTEWVYAAFTTSGDRILVLDATGRVTTWPATLHAWLRRVCLIVHRNFTPYERALYSISPQSPAPCP